MNHRLLTRVLHTAALAVLASALLGTVAFAQFGGGRPPGPPPGGPRFGGPPFGGPGGGRGGPRPSTPANVALPALAAGLHLTAAQQAKIAGIQARLTQQRRSLMPPPGGPPPSPATMGPMMDKMRGLNQAADTQIMAVLTGPQKAALPALLKTLDDLRLAGIPPETYGALHLTAAQKVRITALATASQQAMGHAMDAAGRSGDFGSIRQAMRANRDQVSVKAAAVLTPVQRGIVEKYKAAHPRPRFGGPGGFGPPRPGQRR